MDKGELEIRIEHLTQAVNESVAQHNALVGRLEEAKWLLSQAQQARPPIEGNAEPVPDTVQ